MIIIGIAGGTGSGKTTVVKRIIESLPAGEVSGLPQDSYFKDSSHIPRRNEHRSAHLLLSDVHSSAGDSADAAA